jgi:hypothetical protein
MLDDIDRALTQAYISANVGIATAYPNLPNADGSEFVPPTDALWAAINNVIGQSVVATLGDSGDDNTTGYLQITLNAPINAGMGGINEKRELIRKAFRLGKVFVFNDQEVRIVYMKLSPVFRNGIYATGVIQLFWSAFIRRSVP